MTSDVNQKTQNGNSNTSDVNPLGPYADAAGEVVGTIGAKAGTDGDPQLYGAVYTRLAAAYLEPAVQIRGLGQADIHVLDILRACAFMVSGGMQAQRFRDVIAAGLAGSVHVEAAMERLKAARAAQNGPETAPAAVQEPDDGQGFKPEPADPGMPRAAAPFEVHAADEMDDPFDTADGSAADYGADDVTPSITPEERAPVVEEEEDEARASDSDLLRWVLTPGSDPWGDLLDEAPEGASPGTGRALRPGVTQAMVQARHARLHGLLDTSKAPEGVKPEVWEAAKARALPITFGDRGTA